MTVPLSLLTDLCLSSTHRNMSGLLTNQRWVKDRNKSFLHSSFNYQSSNRCGQGASLVSRNAHSISHSPCVCKGWSGKVFHFLESGHGDGTRTRISRIKSPLQNRFCYTVLKSLKRLTLDLWFIHCPQRETRPDKRSLSLSHAHCWASSFNSVLKDQVAH